MVMANFLLHSPTNLHCCSFPPSFYITPPPSRHPCNRNAAVKLTPLIALQQLRTTRRKTPFTAVAAAELDTAVPAAITDTAAEAAAAAAKLDTAVPAAATDTAAEAAAAAAAAVVEDGGGETTVISVLLFVAFIALSVLTIGVIYLAVQDFLQKREREKFENEQKEEAKKKKKSGGKKKSMVRANMNEGPRGFGQKIIQDEDE